MNVTDWFPFRPDGPGIMPPIAPPENAPNPAFAPWLFPGVKPTAAQEAEARADLGDARFEEVKALGIAAEAQRMRNSQEAAR